MRRSALIEERGSASIRARRRGGGGEGLRCLAPRYAQLRLDASRDRQGLHSHDQPPLGKSKGTRAERRPC